MHFRSVMLFLAFALCGCMGGQAMWLSLPAPKAAKHARYGPVAVAVSDDRIEILHGQKTTSYLGDAPGDRGRDLLNPVPLRSQIDEDLTRELKSLGFQVAPSYDVPKLEVSIRDWWYDDEAGVQRYRLEVRVMDRTEGTLLARSTVQRNQVIGEYSESAVKKALSLIYVDVVHAVLRDNRQVLSALKRQ